MKIIIDKEKLHKKTEGFKIEKKEVLTESTIAKLQEFPEKSLFAKKKEVEDLCAILIYEMKTHGGQGLAANQLGFNLAMFVMKRKIGPPICIVNPIIIKEKGWVIATERCLSLPEEEYEIKRPTKIAVKGFNQWMNPVKYKFEGIEARRACHEIDHLNGRLIGDI